MWSTLIAVLGTLSASVIATLLQNRVTRTAARRQDAAEHRLAVLDALRELATALDAHRRAMWVREDARLTGATQEEYAALRAESHSTRAAISAPLVAVEVLVPTARELARAAAEATYALRAAPDRQTLIARRAHALTAAEALVEAIRLN
ncbi:protein kilB [Streptomyces sp. NPDC003032]